MWEILGLAAVAAIAFAAYRAGSLTPGGTAAAFVVGGIAVGAGWQFAAILLLFFATSSALSRLPPVTIDQVAAKEGRRDAAQVLANGGIGALCALVSQLHSSPVLSAVYTASIAAATADTWATEVGRASGQHPRSIITGRIVPIGASGGMTLAGLAASFGAAALIAVAGAVLDLTHAQDTAVILLAGWIGSLIDSLLGATLQEVRLCPTCGRLTEQPVHRACGTPTRHHHGLRWMNNDAVNAVCTGSGAVISWAALLLFPS